MDLGKLVFAQLMDHLPMHTFRRCVARYDGNHKVKSFSCLDCMASLSVIKYFDVIKILAASSGVFRGRIHLKIPLAPFSKGGTSMVSP